MPELLQGIDIGVVLVVLGGLCIVGVVLLILGQVLGTALGLIGSVAEIVGNILGGGPVAWCGCLLLLGACGGCALLLALGAGVLSTCGTPDAVNFCEVLGR